MAQFLDLSAVIDEESSSGTLDKDDFVSSLTMFAQAYETHRV